jgi:hypothetical protein
VLALSDPSAARADHEKRRRRTGRRKGEDGDHDARPTPDRDDPP